MCAVAYLNAVGVCLDCLLLQIAHKPVAESRAQEVGHPKHTHKYTCTTVGEEVNIAGSTVCACVTCTRELVATTTCTL